VFNFQILETYIRTQIISYVQNHVVNHLIHVGTCQEYMLVYDLRYWVISIIPSYMMHNLNFGLMYLRCILSHI
jgi:hypothetical protein